MRGPAPTRLAIGLVLLVLLTPTHLLAASSEKPRGDTALFYEGQGLYEGKRWDDAASRFSRLLDQYPSSILRDLGYFWLFRSKLMAQKTSEAESVAARFRKEFPESPLLSKVDRELSETRERIAAVAPEKKGRSSPPPTVISIKPMKEGETVSSVKQRRRDKAIALYQKIIRDAPKSAEANKARERLAAMGVDGEGKPLRARTEESAVSRRAREIEQAPPRIAASSERMQGTAPGARAAFSLTISQVADVRVELKKDKLAAYPGEYSAFPITITNLGNASDSFQLASDVPAEFQPAFFADRTGEGRVSAGDPAITETPPIGVGASFAAVLRIRMPIGMQDGQKMEFSTRVSSRYDPSIGRVASGVAVASGPLVTGTFKVNREHVKPGGTLEYVIRVSNNGSARTRDIRAAYTFHPSLIFLSAQPKADGVEQSSRTLSWTIREIPSGSSQEIEVKFKVGDETAAGQEIINRGSLSSSVGGEPTLLASPVVLVDQVAGVRVEGPRDEMRTTPGDRVYLPFSVKNLGNGTDGFTIKVEGSIGKGAAVYADSNGDGLLQAGEPKITGIQNLSAHAVAHLLAEVVAPMAKTDGQKMEIHFQADSVYDRSAKDRAARTLVYALPIVSMSMQMASKESIPGGIISYQLMTLNSGSGVARQVSIVNDLPAELEYVNADPQPSEKNGNRVVWKVGELGPNQKRVVTVSVRARPGLRAGTVIQNETRMTYEDLNGNSYE